VNAIHDKVLYFTEKSLTGTAFLSMVAQLLEKHRPDILRIDPLLAYLGADVNSASDVAKFLRNGLNPLLDKYECGGIICHHTPKAVNRDTSQWRPSDWMYAGAGSADLTNWCRAALVIDPTHSGHVFRFIAAKRGGRIGWYNDVGERVYDRYFCHTDGSICWREATPDEIAATQAKKAGGKPAKTAGDLLALVPPDGTIAKNMLLRNAQDSGIGGKKARDLLQDLLNAEQLYQWQIPRVGTNPEKRISRNPQQLG